MGKGASAWFLILPLLLLAMPLYSQVTLKELAFQTNIDFISVAGTRMEVQASYLNLSYYSKAKLNAVFGGANPHDPTQDVSVDELEYESKPLANAPLRFTFDGRAVSDDGSSVACERVMTDADGKAECNVRFVQEGSGFVEIESRASAGTIKVEYDGETRGSDQFRPTASYYVYSPPKSPALSALGTALQNSLSMNMAYCFPALLVAGLLIASMYYSGRDPFSLFDLTTPRLPKMRPSRVSTGPTMMGIRSATARYNQAKREARKGTVRMAEAMARKAGGSRAERDAAKREVKRLFKDLDAELASMNAKKNFDEAKFEAFRRRLADIFRRHGIDRVGTNEGDAATRKLFSEYMETSGQYLNLYTSSDHAARTMALARAPGGGKLYKWVGKQQKRMGDALDAAEAKLMETPGYSKFIRFVPGAGLLALPKKMLDTIAQRRSAKGFTKYTTNAAIGQLAFMLGSKKDDKGERTAKPWLKKIGRFAEKAGGKYYSWTFKDFTERHNVMARRISVLRDDVEKYRILSADELNHAMQTVMPYILGSLGKPAEKIMKALAKAGLKAEMEELRLKISGETDAVRLASLYQELVRYAKSASKLKNDQEFQAQLKKLSYHALMIETLANGPADRNLTMSERLEQLIKGRMDFDKEFEKSINYDEVRKALRELRRIEADMQGYGVERMEDQSYTGKGKRYIYSASQDPAKKQEHVQKTQFQLDQEMVYNVQTGEWIHNGSLSRLASAMQRLSEGLGSKNGISMGMDPLGRLVFDRFAAVAKILGKENDPEFRRLIDAKNKSMNAFETEYAKSEARNRLLSALTEAIMGASENDRKRICSSLFVTRLGSDSELDGLTNNHRKLVREIYRKMLNHEDFSAELDSLNRAAGGGGRKEYLETLSGWVGRIGLDHKELSATVLELERFVKNRQTMLKAIENLSLDERNRIATKELGLAPLTRKGAKETAEEYEQRKLVHSNEMAERLNTVDLYKKTEKLSKMLGIEYGKPASKKVTDRLGLSYGYEDPSSPLTHSSISLLMLSNILKGTQTELERWGGNMLRAGDLFSGDAKAVAKALGRTLLDYQNDFRSGLQWGQQFEYASMRRLQSFSLYHGAMGQHIETLLYMTRAYNRAAEFAMAKALPHAPVAGSLMGSFADVRDNLLHSYSMQKAFYFNLVDKESKAYDDNFAQARNGKVFDAAAYLALQERGFRFRDARNGIPYVVSSANVGIMPLVEYDSSQVKLPGGGTKDLIIRKGEERDLSPLLARVNISDFSSEVKGIVAIYSKDGQTFKRVDPRRIPEVETLYDSAKVELPRRNDFMKIISGLEGVRFVSASDFVENHTGKGRQTYHKAMANVAEFTYGVFYDMVGGPDSKIDALRDWYAAQARARHALYTIYNSRNNWVSDGSSGRLDAGKYLDSNDVILQDKLDEKQAKTLADAVKKLEDTDRWGNWKKKNLRYIDNDSATYQSAMYEAKLEKDALRLMHKNGQLGVSEAQYKQMLSAVDQKYKESKASYNTSRKENRAFTESVISMVGSHDNTYYGSIRNIVTMSGLVPEFDYKQGLFIGMSFTVESSAMRGGEINRGGRLGGESWVKMNMDTGQGIYENPRWWSVSMYEQQQSPYMTVSDTIHRALLPYVANFYRSQVGLSSFLQRTELDSDWGKQKTKFHTLLGMERGSNDFFGAQAQETLDFMGGSTLLSALRKGGRVKIDGNGNVTSERGWFARQLDRLGVESSHVMSDTQLYNQNRLQDRVLASKEWQDSHLRDSVQEWMAEYKLLQYEDDGAKKAEHERRLKELEQELDPFALRFTDERPQVNQKSAGGGNYFNKDGSRDRFMNLFIVDNVNTWRRIIPGMTETAPFMGGTFLSPEVLAYTDRAATLAPTSRLAMMNNFNYYTYDEAAPDGLRLVKRWDTHHDTYRDVYKYDVPVMMHVIKTQSYIKQYEAFQPIVSSLGSLPFVRNWYLPHTRYALPGQDTQAVNMALDVMGTNQSKLWQNSMLRYYDWDEIRYGQTVSYTKDNSRLADGVAREGEQMAEGYDGETRNFAVDQSMLEFQIKNNKRAFIVGRLRDIWRERSLYMQYDATQHWRNLEIYRSQIGMQK